MSRQREGTDDMIRPVRDQRKHARFDMFDYAQMYREADGDGVNALIVDISIGGAQIWSRSRFVEGEICDLVIGRGWEPPTKVSVEVRYSRPIEDSDLFATGFRFKPSGPKERIDLVDYLHDVFQRTVGASE